MEQIMNYVKPELIVVAAVLYFVGAGLKKAQAVPDKYIPLILGAAGIVICAVWVVATCPLEYRPEYCNGDIYSNRTGNISGRVKHICESDH